MAMKTSSRYDLITCKDLIQPGSPNVYQLKPKKEKIGTLMRMTLGVKNPNKINKTILLVGETGAGKSTLINALVNYAMGVKWKDDVWFQIVEEKKKSQSESPASDVTDFEDEEKSQCESQTTDVIVYEIFGFEGQTLPYSLTIIDTPGFGSTAGTEHDVIVKERLLDLFRSDDGVHEIDAVGLVMKASENRLNDRLRYIFDSVVSLFGKDMEKNIVALITHSNGVTPENVLQALEAANIKCAKDEENETVHFLFDNCQSTQKTRKNKVALKNAWSITEDHLGQFTDFLQSTSAQDLTTTVEVLNRRTRLTACIHNLQERIEFIELKQREIQQTQEVLKKYEQEMKNNEEFTVEVDEVYKVKEPVSEWRWWALGLNYGGAVCCTVCKENCHYPCTLAWYPESCEVMEEKCTLCEGKCCVSDHEKKLYCTVCTGRCPVSVHVKDKQCPVCEGEKKESDHVKTMWKYVSKTRKVQMTKQDMKQKYEKGKAGCEESTSLLETLQKKMDELEKEKDQWVEESFQHVVTLEQMAQTVNSLSTYVHLDFLIEKMKEKGDTEKVQKLKDMKGQMDKNEGIKAALWYRFGRITAAGKADEASTRKTSSKYDHITCKDLIQPGSPNVYRLKPKKENIGTLTRMTLGEKDPNKINKTILLVGETGTGKSTLINALVNYAMGVKWEDDVWFQIVEDEKKSQSESPTSDVTDFEDEEKSQCESQTTDVIVYEIFGFEYQTLPYSLTIIDTPGYGDTRGTEHDAIVSQRLLDLFRSDDGVHEIDAVGLVMKASENRLSDRLRYIFDSIMSLFGKNMEKNIVALFTHSDGVTPKNVLKAIKTAEIRCAEDEKKQPVHFLFNNCQYEDRTEETEALQQADKITMKGLSQFTNFLEKTTSQKLKETMDVLNERMRLAACIHNLQERIEFIELRQTEIQQTQEALQKYEHEMKNNEKFTVEVEQVYKVKEPIEGGRRWLVFFNGAVCCTVCKETCHYPCTLARYPDSCEVMKNKCTLCKDKCFVPDHEKGKPCTKCEGKCCKSFHAKGKQCPVCEGKYNEKEHEKKLYCTVCTGRCPVSAHVKDKRCTVCVDDCCVSGHKEGKQCPVCEGEKKESLHVKTWWKYESETRKVQMTKQDMKQKYEKGKAGCEESTSLLETLQKKTDKLKKEKDQWVEESFQHVVTLEQMALKVDSLSTYVHLDFLIEKMTETGDTEKVQKLEEMKKQMDKNKGIKAAQWYGFGRVAAAGKAAGKAFKAVVK